MKKRAQNVKSIPLTLLDMVDRCSMLPYCRGCLAKGILPKYMYWLDIWQTKARWRPHSRCFSLFSAGSMAMETRDCSASTLPHLVFSTRFPEVAAAEGVAGLHVLGSSNHLPDYGFFIPGSQVQCYILKLNSSVVASYVSAVLIMENIVTVCGSGMCYLKLSLKPPLDNPSIIFFVQSN